MSLLCELRRFFRETGNQRNPDSTITRVPHNFACGTTARRRQLPISMNRKPVILLLLMVSLPLAVLAWLGARIARDEEAVLRQRFHNLLSGQLSDIDQIVVRHFEGLERELRTVGQLSSFAAEDVRSAIRQAPLARQIVVLDPEGQLVYPRPSASLNESEREFLLNARDLLTDRDLIRLSNPDQARGTNTVPQEQQQQTVQQFPDPSQQAGDPNEPDAQRLQQQSLVNQAYPNEGSGKEQPEGWYVWYFGRGVHLIFWQRTASHHVVATLLERPRWMADLIAVLPATVTERTSADPIDTARIRLVDSVGRPVYQWGSYEPHDSAAPFAETAVSRPLTTWRLQALVPEDLVTGARRSVYFNLASGLGAAVAGIAVLGIFFWREYSREMREAARRVSFVNQVSHELKTPLTNIRMYADLLEHDLDQLDPTNSDKPVSRLRIIVSESQRLSRLIGNVLTFSRQQRRTLTLRRVPASVDSVVQRVVEQFTPTLERNGITVQLNLAAGETVMIDVDALEQILVNLINNVEKYAADGHALDIATTRSGDSTTIRVSDHGPGIPVAQHEAVFEPFHRLSDRPVDAAGTGIGLSIARELARLHGGDLRIEATDQGTCFRIELSATDAQ